MSRLWMDLERVDCVAEDIYERYWNDPDPDVRRFILERFAYAIEHALERLKDDSGAAA